MPKVLNIGIVILAKTYKGQNNGAPINIVFGIYPPRLYDKTANWQVKCHQI